MSNSHSPTTTATATPPPPPSAFSHFTSLAEASAATTTRNERHHSRRTNSVGPRPLHLAAGSVVTVGSAPASPLLTSTDEGSTASPYSPRVAGPSTPLSPTISSLRHGHGYGSARRQSSISYNVDKAAEARSPSPSQVGFEFGGRRDRDSVDNLSFSLGAPRSPLSGTSGLTRSSSLGASAKRANRVNAGVEQLQLQQPLASADGGVERAPVTLVEKHAELLHFIAQKESKCLELRTQLAVHEAELLELKKKWERIVNRGFERSQAARASGLRPASSPTSTSTSTSTATLGPAFAASKSDSSSSSGNSASYFPTLLPAPSAPSAIVLEGIKEGVQGVSRLLAAGLETIAQVNAPMTPAEAHVKRARTPEPPTTTTSTTTTSSARSVSPHPHPHPATVLPRKSGQGHGQKESQSSTASAASHASMASSLLSVATASSATSATPSEGLGGGVGIAPTSTSSTSTSGKSVAAESESDGEFGAFEEARTTTRGRRRDGQEQEREREQEQEHEVLMVRDTGATPTMSPNPDFQRRTLQPSEAEDAFDWDDGWGSVEGEKDPEASFEGAAVVQTAEPPSGAPAKLGVTAGLASKVSGAQATQQMSSWVGSMGKKWGEIKGSPTFTKSQKRATLLLSDMQQSLVSALIAPTPLSTAERSASQPSPANSLTSPSSSSSSPSPFSSNASRRDSLLLAGASTRAAPSTSTSRVPALSHSELSLLDDSDESFGEEAEDTVRLTMSAPVLVPTAAPAKSDRRGTVNSSRMTGSSAASPAITKADTEEDEWNW